MKDLFDEIPRAQTAGRVVERQLKDLVRARRLVAGDGLPPEAELAERLGVSRPTLRAALQSLTEQGVLVAHRGAGWTVSPSRSTVAANLALYLRLEDVTFEQLFAARRALEPDIAAAAAEHRTEAHLTSLGDAIDAMRAATTGEAYLAADSTFHATLAAASSNPVFRLLVLPTFELLEDVRERLSEDPSMVEAGHDEHQRILDAVRARDPEAARGLMLAHIDRFVTQARTTLETNPAPASGSTA